MIDFRYHLVSIVAVFLALAVGIVLGTTALNGPVLTDLRSRVSGLATDKRSLEGQVRDLRGQADSGERFAATVSPTLVAGRLAGDSVLVLSTPGAPTDLRDALVSTLRQAGANVVGRVRLRPEYVAADQAVIDDLVNRLAPPGCPLPTGDVGVRAAAELSAALSYPYGGSRVVSADAAQNVVAGFRQAGLLTVDGPDPTPTSLVAVVAGPAPPRLTDDDRRVAGIELDLLTAFASRGAATVAVGPRASADDGGLLAALRVDQRAAPVVSGVDNADSSAGRVAAVLALGARRRGEVGQYGVGRGASALLPTLPTPQPALAPAPQPALAPAPQPALAPAP